MTLKGPLPPKPCCNSVIPLLESCGRCLINSESPWEVCGASQTHGPVQHIQREVCAGTEGATTEMKTLLPPTPIFLQRACGPQPPQCSAEGGMEEGSRSCAVPPCPGWHSHFCLHFPSICILITQKVSYVAISWKRTFFFRDRTLV